MSANYSCCSKWLAAHLRSYLCICFAMCFCDSFVLNCVCIKWPSVFLVLHWDLMKEPWCVFQPAWWNVCGCGVNVYMLTSSQSNGGHIRAKCLCCVKEILQGDEHPVENVRSIQYALVLYSHSKAKDKIKGLPANVFGCVAQEPGCKSTQV